MTTDEKYAEAARDTKLFLEGRRHDLMESLESRMMEASDTERFEQAAAYRDLLHTLSEIEERQKIAAAQGDDIDVLAWHAEPPLVAVNLFHLRGGRVVDRRDFYWEDLAEFEPAEFLSSLLKQLYLDAAYLPRAIHVPMDFEDRELLEDILSERGAHLEPPRSRVEILMPQRGAKHAFLELVEKNARHSFEQRFRVLKPSSKAIVEALEQALSLPEPPRRIESFDISHLQGSDTVASMVVWEDGRMKKSDYRKFIIRGEWGNDDFASMKETVERRYRRLQEEKKPFPGLILIDGGIGQLHAAAAALEKLEVINQPVASIAKQEEIIYVLGQEDQPIRLEHHSPILHLIQQIRDETHRFAVGFHRQRRAKRTIQTGLENIPGVGPRTAQKLLAAISEASRNCAPPASSKSPRSFQEALAERVSAHLAGSNGSSCLPQAVVIPRLLLPGPCATFEAGKEYAMSENNAGSKVSFFLVGLGIGALVGILFAPKSGEETREFLAQKADEGREYAQRKARELRERAEDILERSKTVAVRQKETISAAVDAGRDAYQREKAKAQ